MVWKQYRSSRSPPHNHDRLFFLHITNDEVKEYIKRGNPNGVLMDKTLGLMIVDDNPHARGALSAYITTQDWLTVICEASNGEEAVEKIKSNTPDIVLMDIRMPVMDGLEATKIIKKNWPQIKIVILTMYPDCQMEALSAGADVFLIKGCNMDEITSSFHALSQH